MPRAVKRGRLTDEPADEGLLEERGQFLLEDRPLFGEVPRLQNGTEIAAVAAGQPMARADETPEQAVAVEASLEGRDTTPAIEAPRLPIGPGRGIEMRPDDLVIGGHVLGPGGAAEEAEERGMVGQVPEGGEFQPPQGHMRAVEVDGADPCRVGREVGERVAAPRGDGDDVVLRPQPERRHVHHRVFPDLRIDQPAEGRREQAFRYSRFREGPVAMDGLSETQIRLAADGPCCARHERSHVAGWRERFQGRYGMCMTAR